MLSKRLSTTLLGMLMAVLALAAPKNLQNDITLVFYEQPEYKYEATIALKNNTVTDVHNLVFVITYMDMDGKELNYEEYTEKVDIAPGMTKTLRIRGWGTNQYRYYYKSEKNADKKKAFQIKFQLKDYNVEAEDIESTDDDFFSSLSDKEVKEINDTYDDAKSFVTIGIIILLLLFVAYIGLYPVVAIMAKNRNRPVILWVLLSFFVTPFVTALILLVLDPNEDNYDE